MTVKAPAAVAAAAWLLLGWAWARAAEGPSSAPAADAALAIIPAEGSAAPPAALIDALTARLTAEGVRLADRERAAAALTKKGINLTGPVDPSTALRAGRAASASLLVSLEAIAAAPAGLNTPGGRPALCRGRALEARTGAILAEDCWLLDALRKDLAPLAAFVRGARDRAAIPEDRRRYAAIVELRGDAASPRVEPLSEALAVTLSRDLAGMPGVIALEPARMERLKDAAPASKPERRLRAAAVSVEGALRHGAERALIFDLRLTPLAGSEARTLRVASESGSFAELRRRAAEALAEAWSVAPPPARDAAEEAEAFTRRGQAAAARPDLREAARCLEAAMALRPDEATRLRLYTAWATLAESLQPGMESNPDGTVNHGPLAPRVAALAAGVRAAGLYRELCDRFAGAGAAAPAEAPPRLLMNVATPPETVALALFQDYYVTRREAEDRLAAVFHDRHNGPGYVGALPAAIFDAAKTFPPDRFEAYLREKVGEAERALADGWLAPVDSYYLLQPLVEACAVRAQAADAAALRPTLDWLAGRTDLLFRALAPAATLRIARWRRAWSAPGRTPTPEEKREEAAAAELAVKLFVPPFPATRAARTATQTCPARWSWRSSAPPPSARSARACCFTEPAAGACSSSRRGGPTAPAGSGSDRSCPAPRRVARRSLDPARAEAPSAGPRRVGPAG